MRDLDAELNTLVADLRADAARSAWPQPPEIRVRGDRRTVRQRFTAAGVALVALAVLVTVTAYPSWRRGPAPAGPSPSASSPGRAILLNRIGVNHSGEITAVGMGADSLWLAFGADPGRSGGPGPGELLRLDAASLEVTARWAIVGAPEAVAVSTNSVWVAGGIADGSSAVVGANQVQQFDLDGRLTHTYPVTVPLALASTGSTGNAGSAANAGSASSDDGVWVEHGDTGSNAAFVSRLHDGVADPPLRLAAELPQRGQPLRVCADTAYVASQSYDSGYTYVQRLSPAGVRDMVGTQGLGFATVVCQNPGAALVLTPNPACLYRLGFDGGKGGLFERLPQFTNALDSAGSLAWLSTVGADQRSTVIWPLNTQSGLSGDSVTLRGDIVLAVAVGTQLWAVGSDPTQPGQAIVTMVASG